MQDMIWETRDGRLIPVIRMETGHIIKCIARIQRDWPWRVKYLERLKMELILRQIKEQT